MKRIVTSLFLAALAGLNAWAQDAYEQLTIMDGVCQISSAEDLANFAQAVNDGYNDLDAVLTADIDQYTGMVVANSGTHYAGTFDGQYHTITIDLVSTESSWGLFRHLDGTVKNLHVAGKLEAKQNKIGVICGEIFGGIIENCWVSADILATYNGDAAVSGIVGRGSQEGSIIRNCVFSGNVSQGTTATYNCAGIVGWAGAKTYIQNCIVTASFDTDHSQGNARPIARHADDNTNGECLNCFFVDANGDKLQVSGAQQVTLEQVKSGEIGYNMNGDQTEILWTQNIGEDPVPVPFPTHETIYAAGNLNCIGQSADGTALTYSNEKTQDLPAHQYENGICVVCGSAEPDLAELIDGYYQLGTVEQLVWFAAKVNNGETSLNAVLTDDIDLAGSEDKFIPIGTNANHYAGTFDGQFHTINVNLVATEASYGFFRYLNGTVKNLHISGTYEAKFNKTGVICGEIFGGLVENCWVSSEIAAVFGGDAATAAIAGRGSADGSIIRNCLVTSNIDQGSTTTWNCASIMGWSGSKSTIENCLFIGQINVDESQGNGYIIARNPGNLTISNCYFVNPYASVNDGATQVSEEQLKSGEIALALGAAFRQNIGEDDYPVLDPTHGYVLEITEAGYATMFNTESSVIVPAGVEAFIGLIVDEQLWLRPLQGIVNLMQAVVLKGAPGYYSFIPVDVGDGQIYNNLFGVKEPFEADGTQYVLAQKDGVVGFYQAEPGTIIAAGKAYIQFSSGVKGFTFNTETGIDAVQSAQSIDQSEVYDLSGRRVEKVQKGMYIINGKKVLK